MKVLLTGATGFIGSHVARRLSSAGHEVTALVLPGDGRGAIRDLERELRIVESDLLAGPPRVDAELCIHLAWYVEPGRYLSAPQNADFLCASFRLAQALPAGGCRRLVVAGTYFEYDSRVRTPAEDAPTRPQHLYPAAKLALFTMLEPWCRLVGMSFAWTRLFHPYGPHEDRRRIVPHVINCLLDGQVAKLTPGEQVRDFLHVEDVAAGICAVALGGLEGAVNIGSGEPARVRDVATKIGELVGRPDLLALGAMPMPEGEPPYIVADNARLRSTGWRPRYDLGSGLRQTIEWWRSVRAAS
jgi:nucleoside-diphosphate-sugar epimerase